MKAGWAAHTGVGLHPVTCPGHRPKFEGLISNINRPESRCQSEVLQMTGHLHLAKHFAADMLVFLQSPGQRPMALLFGFGRLRCLSQHCPLLERLLKGGFRELVCSHHPRAYLCADVVSLLPSNKLINTSIIDWSDDVLKFNPTPWPFLLKSHLRTSYTSFASFCLSHLARKRSTFPYTSASFAQENLFYNPHTGYFKITTYL